MGKFVDKLIESCKGDLLQVHPVHLSVAIMNDQNAAGTHAWMKCPNCGKAFDSKQTGTSYLCSDKCETEYIEYLNDPTL